MTDSKEVLSQRSLIIIGIASLMIFIIGLSLIALGYNEAFYIHNSVVQLIFEIITLFGNPIFLIVIIAIFTFSYDKRFAQNFFCIYIISGYLNAIIKDLIKDPRPSTNISKSAERGYASSGYGFPSGHAQIAVSIWGFTAYHFKDKLKSYVIPFIFSILILLVSISRIIIGVHDVQDIIGGLLIGIGLLVMYLYVSPILIKKLTALSFIIKLVLSAAIPILLCLLGTYMLPESGYGINIYAFSGGLLLGLLVGQLVEERYIKYEPSTIPIKQKIINLIIGLILLMSYLFFLYGIIIGTDLHEFIRSAIASFIITLVMPLIFKIINRN